MASLTSFGTLTRRNVLRGLLAAVACTSLGMAKKGGVVTVRFYEEARELDSDRFARPFTFRHPTRQGYISNIPAIHEGMIKIVYPFQAADGTWGCTFFLDTQGQNALEVVSTSHRDSVLVAFLGTKHGTHQVVELLIDKRITDGIISIPSGLTELEIAAITQSWPVVGQKKKK